MAKGMRRIVARVIDRKYIVISAKLSAPVKTEEKIGKTGAPTPTKESRNLFSGVGQFLKT